MDMLSPAQKPREWPNAPAERGKYYGCPDPVWQGHQLVVMSNDTWLDFGTLCAKQREVLAKQDRKIIEQNAVIAQLTAKLNETLDRLKATRAARKKEKLAQLGLAPKKVIEDGRGNADSGHVGQGACRGDSPERAHEPGPAREAHRGAEGTDRRSLEHAEAVRRDGGGAGDGAGGPVRAPQYF